MAIGDGGEMKTARSYVYDIYVPSEHGAGIRGYSDTVTITIDSGDPGGDETGPDSFKEFMTASLKEWFDGAHVSTDDKQ